MSVTNETGRFKQALEHKREELGQVLLNRDGLEIERSPDQMDEIQFAAGRELAIRGASRESGLLKQVTAALQRIEGGTFGVCQECQCLISPKRLAVVPWAVYCLQCQDIADRAWQDVNYSLGEHLYRAA